MAWSEISNSEKIVRILSAILAVVFIVVLVLIKLSNPEFKLGLMLFISALIIVFFIGVSVVFHFWNKKNQKQATLVEKAPGSDQRLPPPITMEQCRELASMQLLSPIHADYFKGEVKELNELIGDNIKSYVYCITGQTVYSKKKYAVIMNRHFPNETMTIIPNPKPADISRAMRLAASSPEKEPDIEETTIRSPFTGTETTTRKISQSKSEEQKRKEADL